jgi:hypothetical protein
MLKKILVTLLVVSALASFAVFGSFAIWTDTASVPNNVFSTGSVDISTNPTTALVTFSGMAPGDSTGGQSLTVSNAGTLELRYAVTMTATNTDLKGLYAELELTIAEEGTDCATFDGSVLYGPAPFLLSGNLIGDPAQGEDTGDRTLAGSANEVLCFKVDLPDDAPNGVQGATTTAVFTFDAEQTSSNP